MRFKNESLKKSAAWAVEALRVEGGLGGVIALDNKGNGSQVIPELIAFAYLFYSCHADELARDVSWYYWDGRDTSDSYF